MKHYKLLKWYPTLPKDWKEGMIVEIGNLITKTKIIFVSQH